MTKRNAGGLFHGSFHPGAGARTRRELASRLHGVVRENEAAPRPYVQWCVSARIGSLARTVIGVVTLVARLPATPHARVNVPPRSARRDP